VREGEVSHIQHDISKGVWVLGGGWCKGWATGMRRTWIPACAGM